MGSGQWAGHSGRQNLEGRLSIECPLVGSKGDELMVNNGLIASANMSKLNINNLAFVLIFLLGSGPTQARPAHTRPRPGLSPMYLIFIQPRPGRARKI